MCKIKLGRFVIEIGFFKITIRYNDKK